MKVEVKIMLIQLGKNVALLWILRILAVPVVLVLFAAGFLLNLRYGEAAASAAVAFLISPIALPQLLMWVGNLLICAASALYTYLYRL